MKPILRMLKDVFAFSKTRLVLALVFSFFASLVEGVGIALLIPVLSYATNPDEVLTKISQYGITLSGDSIILISITGFVILACTATWLIWQKTILASAIRCDYISQLSHRAQAALLNMRPDFLAREDRVAITHLLTIDVDVTGQAIRFLFDVSSYALRIGALVFIFVAFSFWSALATLLILGIIVFVAKPFDSRARQHGSKLIKAGRRHLFEADNSLAHAALIKSHQAEKQQIEAHKTSVSQRYSLIHTLLKNQASARAFGATAGFVAVAVVAALSLTVLNRTINEAIVMLVALSRLLPTIIQFHSAWRSALASTPSHERIMNFLERATDAREPEPQKVNPTQPSHVVLEDVSISRVAGSPAHVRIDHIEVDTGKLTVVMGPSGAGKTTLALGLCGMLPLAGGKVLLNGEELQDYERMKLRSVGLLVQQEATLLNATISENLRLGKAGATEAEMWEALTLAAADEFVKHLPEGLDTIVGDKGASLSGGERQRVALAQALVSKPSLLVLDEVTSALDSHSETLVLNNLCDLLPSMTVVFISHREEVAKRGTKCFVMTDGRIKEEQA